MRTRKDAKKQKQEKNKKKQDFFFESVQQTMCLIGPMTLRDTIYSQYFPSYDELDAFAMKKSLMWQAELSVANYELLKLLYDSRGDRAVMRQVGQALAYSFQVMQAMFYIYDHYMGNRVKELNVTRNQWTDFMYKDVKRLTYEWDEIGEWRC